VLQLAIAKSFAASHAGRSSRALALPGDSDIDCSGIHVSRIKTPARCADMAALRPLYQGIIGLI
jgi:hypothetical protein